MEKKTPDAETLLEMRKNFVKKMAGFLSGRTDGKEVTDIISRFLVIHDNNMKTFSLDTMNEVAKIYVKGKKVKTEEKDNE